MKRVLAIVALVLLGSASGRAGAGLLHVFSEWYDDDIADIIQNVKDVRTKVTTGATSRRAPRI